MRLLAAGNTVIPALLLIREMGYTLTISKDKDTIMAEKDGNTFIADDPVMVLGLIKLFEEKGGKWQATDQEIDQWLKDIC